MPKGKTNTARVIITAEEYLALTEHGRVFPFERITRGNLEKFKDGNDFLKDYPDSKLMVLSVL